MRVRELIEKLKEMDQDAVVNIPAVDNEGYLTDRLVNKVEQNACGWDDVNECQIFEVFIE